MKKILMLPFAMLAPVVGRFSWAAPPWLAALGRLVAGHRRASGALLVLAAVALGAYLWFDSLPKPIMVVTDPIATCSPV